MAIKTINGILKPDSIKTASDFNSDIKNAVNNAETVDSANKYVGLVFNLKDNKIEFVPSTSIETDFSVQDTTIVDGSSGSADTSYVRTTPTPATVGGAAAGTTFDSDLAGALDKILYPYVKPTFTSFYLSSQITSLEVGDKIAGGSRTFNWATSEPDNISPNSIDIISGSTTILSGAANDGTETFDIGADIVKTTNTSHYFKIVGTDTNGDTFQRLYAVYWKWRLYYGSSPLETMTESDIKALQSSFLYTSENYTYNTPENNYKWICYPTVFGTASKFTDTSTGFGVAMEAPQTISVTNAFGVTTDYYCYRSTNSMAGAVSIKIG